MIALVRAGLASACVALSVFAVAGASAADLNDGWRGGSLKDDYAPARASAGPCYIRGDVGYAINTDPSIDHYSATTGFSNVGNVGADNSWVGEVGFGCGQGSRGFRAELTLGYRSKFESQGEPQLSAFVTPAETMHVNITSYTGMANLYYDFGNFRGFTPYVGAGIGFAVNDMDDVSFTGNPLQIRGGTDVDFAWQVMAGVGYQISDRAILDIGYRYIDLGGVESNSVDTSGAPSYPVIADDLTAHEIKVGLRFHLGARQSYVIGDSMK